MNVVQRGGIGCVKTKENALIEKGYLYLEIQINF